MDFAAWHLWVIAGILLCVLEMKLPGFVIFWLGVGALAAAVPAAIGLALWVQLLVFIVVAVALFAASRTIFRRFLMSGATRIRTNVEAMTGAEATVVEPIAEGGSGTVRINGELWAARSLEGPLAPGELAIIERVDGLKLYVRRPGVAWGGRGREGVA